MATNISYNYEYNFLTGLSDEENPPKKGRVYSKEDLVVINKYKEKYQAASSANQRKMVAMLEILPALFNHWKAKGKVYTEETKRKKCDVGSSSSSI